MSIDGIGKKTGLGGAGPSLPASAPRTPFDAKIDRLEPTDKSDPIAPTGTTPLDRLKRGEINLDAYADIKVDEATKHLAALAPADLADVRALLRDKITSDPLLVDLVKQITGHAPTPRDE